METIKNLERIKIFCDSWEPNNIAFVKSIHWVDNDLVISFYSQTRNKLVKWPNMQDFFLEICFRFINIKDLRINFSGSGLQQLSGFDIIDISINDWEKVQFEIEDYENNLINFYCEKIEVISVSKNSHLK